MTKTTKQTLELDVPEGYELTGEYRAPVRGEFFLAPYPPFAIASIGNTANIYAILRKKSEPLTIDWSHVSSEFNYLAKDADGTVFIFAKRPNLHVREWSSIGARYAPAHHFASFKNSDIDWRESLVIRPGYDEGEE